MAGTCLKVDSIQYCKFWWRSNKSDHIWSKRGRNECFAAFSIATVKRVISQSDCAEWSFLNTFVLWKSPKPLQLEAFAKAINCSLGNNVVECARGKTVEEILKGQMAITMGSYKGPLDIVGPIVDGEFLPDLPENLFGAGNFNDVDVIMGFTSNEGALLPLIRPPELFKDGVEKEFFETVVREELLYSRELKNSLVEDLILFEYTNHDDPGNKHALRQLLIDSFTDSGFVSPAVWEARALAKASKVNVNL